MSTLQKLDLQKLTSKHGYYFLVQDTRPTLPKSYNPIGIYDNLGDGIVNLYCNPARNSLYVVLKNAKYSKTISGSFVGEVGVFYNLKGLKYIDKCDMQEYSVDETTIMTQTQLENKRTNFERFLSLKEDDILKSGENTIQRIEKYAIRVLLAMQILKQNGIKHNEGTWENIQIRWRTIQNFVPQNEETKIQLVIKLGNILTDLEQYYSSLNEKLPELYRTDTLE